MYTAEAAEGLNTHAVVGYDWLTVTGEGNFEDDGSGRYRNVELQKYVDGAWIGERGREQSANLLCYNQGADIAGEIACCRSGQHQ